MLCVNLRRSHIFSVRSSDAVARRCGNSGCDEKPPILLSVKPQTSVLPFALRSILPTDPSSVENKMTSLLSAETSMQLIPRSVPSSSGCHSWLLTCVGRSRHLIDESYELVNTEL